jgi:hypothetical protein
MWDALASRSASVAATPELGAGVESPAVLASPRRGCPEGRPAPPRTRRGERVGMPLPTSVRSSTAFPRVCCRRGRASPCISQTARDPGVSSRAVPRFTAPRLPRRAAGSPPHAEERESGHASPYIGSQVPPSPCLLPEWTSLSLHLSVSPCIFSRNRPSPGIVIAERRGSRAVPRRAKAPREGNPATATPESDPLLPVRTPLYAPTPIHRDLPQ